MVRSELPEAGEISVAISRKQMLAFSYKGLSRVIEPHTLGLDTGGRMLLCGYQVSGDSRSGTVEGWKFFDLKGIDQLRMLDERFTRPRPEYRRDDGAFARILAQL